MLRAGLTLAGCTHLVQLVVANCAEVCCTVLMLVCSGGQGGAGEPWQDAEGLDQGHLRYEAVSRVRV